MCIVTGFRQCSFPHTDDAIMKSYREQEGRRIYVMPQNLSSYVQTGMRVHAANLSPVSFEGESDRYRYL